MRQTKHERYTEGPNSPRPEKARQVKSKVKSMLIIFFDVKEVLKNFDLADQEPIAHTTVTLSGYYVKVCEDFSPNFGDRRTGCYNTTTHRLTFPFH
jgi:hypothetical protein